VAKPEWGTKRICLGCGARFYDMNRDPIVCPACSSVFDPAVQTRPRRTRAAPAVAKVAPVVVEEEAEVEEEVVVDDEVESEGEDEAVAGESDDEDEEEEEADAAIEDVSELGDDDMTDVIETDLDEDESER
jgi:uncharacterized protein (TIGR02300 family)